MQRKTVVCMFFVKKTVVDLDEKKIEHVSANRLSPNFYLTRSNMRLVKAAPRVAPVESNFPFIVPLYVLYVTAFENKILS